MIRTWGCISVHMPCCARKQLPGFPYSPRGLSPGPGDGSSHNLITALQVSSDWRFPNMCWCYSILQTIQHPLLRHILTYLNSYNNKNIIRQHRVTVSISFLHALFHLSTLSPPPPLLQMMLWFSFEKSGPYLCMHFSPRQTSSSFCLVLFCHEIFHIHYLKNLQLYISKHLATNSYSQGIQYCYIIRVCSNNTNKSNISLNWCFYRHLH